MTAITKHSEATLSASMKMAELLGYDSSLLGVLPRMGIGFGFGDDTVEQACTKSGVNPATFLLICNVYAFDDYIPTPETLHGARLQDILTYLHSSHSYYIDVAINNLARLLENLIAPCNEMYKKTIRKFFTDYKEELLGHFRYEEEKVFPYVRSVLEHKGSDYNIMQYETNHSNVEEKLGDLRNIIMKYLPKECDNTAISVVLSNLWLLERDLHRHTVIEDEILVPIVNSMEEHGR